MSLQKKLKDLIENEVLIEIDDYLDELFEIIASKQDDEFTKEELESTQEMKKEFNALLEEIEQDSIDDEEASELIQEINLMIEEKDSK